LKKGHAVKRICSPGSAVVTAAFIVAAISFAADSADDEGFAIFRCSNASWIPRMAVEWQLVGVAHEAGNLNDIRTIPGNAVAVKAFRDGMLPFPQWHNHRQAGLERHAIG